jgi:dihydroflavonol-4-reductase
VPVPVAPDPAFDYLPRRLEPAGFFVSATSPRAEDSAVDASPSSAFWSGTPVCVLGGTGFLGRHLVARLLDAGAAVRTLSLPGGEPCPAHPRLDARTGDATDRGVLADAAVGARVVFLAAGPVGADPAAARKMGAHTAVLDAVLAALPRGARLVLTSSIVAVGATRRGDVLNEDSPFPNAKLRVGYVRAKCAAEQAALAASRDRDVVVVNPGYLFGPDDPGHSAMGELCVKFWRGRLAFAPPGGVSAADVRDVADGHLLAAERGVTGRRYILGGENVRFSELFADLARAAGLRHAILPSFRPAMPAGGFWAAAAVAELGHRLTGRTPQPSFEFVRMFRQCWFVSSARAEAELGYRRRPLAGTLSDAFAWHASRSRVAPRGINRLWLRRAG